MTAQVENNRGPIWFFTTRDNGLVQKLGEANRAIATFTSKGHDLFATLHGRLNLDNDRVVIDRLWNRYVAAWYERGKDDPKLALLRLDAERAETAGTPRASSPASDVYSGPIPSKTTRTRLPRSASNRPTRMP